MEGWRTPSSSSSFFKPLLVLRLIPTSWSCVFEPLLALVFFKLLRAFFLSRLSSNSSNSFFLKFEEKTVVEFFFLFVFFWRKTQLKLFFFFFSFFLSLSGFFELTKKLCRGRCLFSFLFFWVGIFNSVWCIPLSWIFVFFF